MSNEYIGILGEENRRPMTSVSRVLASLAGVSADSLEMCSREEQHAAVRNGLLILTLMLLMWATWAVSIHTAVKPTGWVLFGVGVVAALFAGIMALIDHAIMQFSWFKSGERDARLRDFNSYDQHRGDGWRGVMAGAIRLAMSALIAHFMATFLLLFIFDRDITEQIRQTTASANDAIVANVTARVDGEIARVADQIKSRSAEVASLQSASKTASEVEEQRLARRQAAYEVHLDALRTDLEAARRDADTHRQDAIAEENGVKIKPSSSGIPGKLRKYNAAIENARLADARATTIQSEIDRLEANRPPDQVRVDAVILTRLMALEKETSALSAKRDTLVSSRDEDIKTGIAADPRHQVLTDGLLIRARALSKLEEDPSAWKIVLIAHLMLMMVEMSAVVVKVFFKKPTLYALRLSLEFEKNAALEIAQAQNIVADAAASTMASLDSRDAVRQRYHQARSERRRTGARVWRPVADVPPDTTKISSSDG